MDTKTPAESRSKMPVGTRKQIANPHPCPPRSLKLVVTLGKKWRNPHDARGGSVVFYIMAPVGGALIVMGMLRVCRLLKAGACDMLPADAMLVGGSWATALSDVGM